MEKKNGQVDIRSLFRLGIIGLFIVSVVSLVGCGGSKSAQQFAVSYNKAEQEERDSFMSRRFLVDAVKDYSLENYKESYYNARRALDKDPYNSGAMYLLSKLYFGAGRLDDALEYAVKAVKIDSTNKWYWQNLGIICMHMEKYNCAIGAFERAIEQDPNDIYLYEPLLQLLQEREEWNKAIKYYRRVVKWRGDDPEALVQLARLYYLAGKKDSAMIVLKRAVESPHPPDDAFKLLLDLLINEGKYQEARTLIKQWKEKNPDYPYLYLHLAEIYRNQKEYDSLTATLIKYINDSNSEADEKATFLFKYINDNLKEDLDTSHIISISEALADKYKDQFMPLAVAGDLLSLWGEDSLALIMYKRALKVNDVQLPLWQQIITIHLDRKEYDSAKHYIERALELFPDQPMLLWFGTFTCYQLKNYICAITHGENLLDIIRLTGEFSQLRQPVMQIVADSYYWLGDYAKSDSLFEQMLREGIADAVAMNNYAYYLSLRSRDLDKALALIKKAIRQDPNNPSFLDTYGWVLYKMGKIKEAKKWIEKSLANGGDQSAEVLEHYGDILYKLGDIDGAVEYWQKALEKGGDKERLERKIQERKLIEE
ncbi:MAG: tetratricopeptide repeat protein [Chlorobi bacterium]|nr:tetratricopeptide repeat protein [Chlorobiota bacterium]